MAGRHPYDRRWQYNVDDDDDDEDVYNRHQAYGRQRQRDNNSDGEYDSENRRYESLPNMTLETRAGQAYHERPSRSRTYPDEDTETNNPQVDYRYPGHHHPKDEEDSDTDEEDYKDPRPVTHHRNTPPIPGMRTVFPDNRQRRPWGRNSPDRYRSPSPPYYQQNSSSEERFWITDRREPNDEPQISSIWLSDQPDINVNARGDRSPRQQVGGPNRRQPPMAGYNRLRGERQQRYDEDQPTQQPRRRIQQPTTYSARGRRSHPMQQRPHQNPRGFRDYDTPDKDDLYNLDFERYNSQSPWHRRRQNITTTRCDQDDDVNFETLAEILVQKPALRASLLHLLETYQLEVSLVRKLVLANPNIFQVVGEVVELRINVKICSAHNGDKGCVNRSECKDLHICSKFSRNQCQKEDCVMGHSWLTNHNIRILDSFKIHNLSQRSKEKVLQASLTTHNNTLHSPLNVCYSYNQDTCRRRDCYNLHICLNFVTGHCSGPQCQLNHDILAPDCSRKLQDSGIDVNESPRDVLVALLEANPSIKKRKTEVVVKSPPLPNLETTHPKSKKVSSETQNSTPTNKPKKNKPKKNRTVWTHFARGDVDILEICYDSVESVCNNESNGCKRLHAIDHYHWQLSEDGNSWINLQQHQIRSLEQSFCDVNNDNSKLPRFDPSRHQNSSNFLLFLIGRDSWLADFKTMKITNSNNTKSLQIRRLCTEIVPGKKVLPSSFIWYFLDQQQNWVEYGKVDTLGKTDLVSSLTTHDIEKQFLQDSSSSLTFSNSQFSYTLDFKTMTQTNQHTSAVREIRRRPEVHLQDEDEKQEGGKHRKPPSDWEKMKPNERLKRVTISATSEEYKKVVQLLGNKIPSTNVTKLERVQNLFHWYAFQNKIEEMTSIYGDVSQVKVQQLFHGTGHDIVPKICSENFDPRLHGLSAGQAYGQGTYFARDANLSYGYCKADSSGLKYLFVAQVAVGSSTLGNSSMARPPINPSTGAPFDSTVDNVANPSIIVKYDKAEYYPQYIFTLK